VLQFLLAPTSRADLDAFARRQLGSLLTTTPGAARS